MTVIGYARVSTTDQSLDIQEAALKAAGCGNSPQSKWRILIRSMIGSNSSKDAAALRQSSGAPTWGVWTIGAVEWMSGAQDVVAAQNPARQGFWN
jgi:Resolvase, N terminal domain